MSELEDFVRISAGLPPGYMHVITQILKAVGNAIDNGNPAVSIEISIDHESKTFDVTVLDQGYPGGQLLQ